MVPGPSTDVSPASNTPRLISASNRYRGTKDRVELIRRQQNVDPGGCRHHLAEQYDLSERLMVELKCAGSL